MKPRAVDGLPILGNTLDLMRRPVPFLMASYKAYGPIFRIRIGFQSGVVLVGEELQREFFARVDQDLTPDGLYGFMNPMFGGPVMMAETDLSARRYQVAIMRGAFEGRRTFDHRQIMIEESRQCLAELGRSGEWADVWELSRRYTQRVAARSLLGAEVLEFLPAVSQTLDDLARGMEFFLPPWLPLKKFRTRDRARNELEAILKEVVIRREQRGPREADLLDSLLREKQAGRMAPDVMLRMCLIALFTGYITSAAQLAWAWRLYHFSPSAFEALASEPEENLGRPGSLGYRSALEVARLHPVMTHFARRANTDLVIRDVEIGRGSQVILVPSLAHSLENEFAHAWEFDPDRYVHDPGAGQAPRHIGFSGGEYRCPGRNFGLSEISVICGMAAREGGVELSAPTGNARLDLGVIRPAAQGIRIHGGER